MNFVEKIGNRYELIYTITDLTDTQYERLSFRTDYEIVSTMRMKNFP